MTTIFICQKNDLPLTKGDLPINTGDVLYFPSLIPGVSSSRLHRDSSPPRRDDRKMKATSGDASPVMMR